MEAYLIRRAKAQGGEVRKVRWIGRCGAPDRLVLLPGHEPFLLELKAPGKRPTVQQFREMERLAGFGLRTAWADTPESVEAVMSEMVKKESQR
ncbi:MAG: Bordetella virus [Verrucomicrobiota bacterium]